MDVCNKKEEDGCMQQKKKIYPMDVIQLVAQDDLMGEDFGSNPAKKSNRYILFEGRKGPFLA